MFISNADKQYLIDQVKVLVRDMNAASTAITTLNARIKILEAGFVVLKEEAKRAQKVKKPKKPLTAAQKAKQREYQRAYNERKKQEKKDWELIQGLAKENTNVSA